MLFYSVVADYEDSSSFKQSLINFNFNQPRAIENIPVVNLTMKGKDICD